MEFIGKKVWIKTHYETFLRSDIFDGYVNLTSNTKEWEEFIIEGVDENKIAFKCYDNRFISVEEDGNIRLKDKIDNWEKFEVTEKNRYYLIKSYHGGYLKAYEDKTIKMQNTNEPTDETNFLTFEIARLIPEDMPIVKNI
jgi:hypothetical protein